MQAFYDSKPQTYEAVGNGSFTYRYDIKEEAVQNASQSENGETSEERTQFSCSEVTVFAPVTANSITEAVLTDRWERDYEQKLVNEYNAAQLGLLSKTEAAQKTEAYKAFLTERARLKAQVDADCEELGIR